MKKYIKQFILIISSSLFLNSFAADNNFDTFLKPLFENKCNNCHGKKKTKGKINIFELKTYEQFKANAGLIKEVIEVIDTNDMPPEDETQLTKQEKEKLLLSLKVILQESANSKQVKDIAFRRLNRFQYNYTVKDLFKLKKDIFSLPEKLMNRRGNYLARVEDSMPNKVNVFNVLHPAQVFKDVEPFPQDLRAMHGFDNQADHLSLPPILLDSFLKLSLSIVNSPDFNKNLCGIWNEFFKEPVKVINLNQEIKSRLKPFLNKAFRDSVDAETLNRYTNYAESKIKSGLSFTEGMKKVASAILCSPRFLYRVKSTQMADKNFELASKLSYFLWASTPDERLISLAQKGQLKNKKILTSTVDRMLKDPKVERFLDSFPTQWLQLETIKSAVPDKKLYRNYSLDKRQNPGMNMIIEPLLLFDAVYIENRPLHELLAPKFTYHNEFLKKWYSLNDKTVDPKKRAEEDRKNIDQVNKLRQGYTSKLQNSEKEMAALLKPIRNKIKTNPQDNKKKKKDANFLIYDAQVKEVMKHLSKPQNKRRLEIEREIKLNQKLLKENPVLEGKRIDQYRRKQADNALVNSLRSTNYERVPLTDPRYGGIITNAAILTMTSAPKRTQPITRGAWIIEVIFNDPPPPPPNDVPPLDEENVNKKLTIKETFAEHRKNPDCAGCHARLDPLGFSLENYDVVGLWRDKYENKRDIDASGTMMKRHKFKNALEFKDVILKEKKRFAKGFTAHLLRFALSRKLSPAESITIDNIVKKTEKEDFKIKSIIREVILSESFSGLN